MNVFVVSIPNESERKSNMRILNGLLSDISPSAKVKVR